MLKKFINFLKLAKNSQIIDEDGYIYSSERKIKSIFDNDFSKIGKYFDDYEDIRDDDIEYLKK